MPTDYKQYLKPETVSKLKGMELKARMVCNATIVGLIIGASFLAIGAVMLLLSDGKDRLGNPYFWVDAIILGLLSVQHLLVAWGAARRHGWPLLLYATVVLEWLILRFGFTFDMFRIDEGPLLNFMFVYAPLFLLAWMILSRRKLTGKIDQCQQTINNI